MLIMKTDPHRDCGRSLVIPSLKRFFFMSIMSIKAILCPWFYVREDPCPGEFCYITLFLFSPCFPAWKITMRHCDPGEKLGGMGVELSPCPSCLEGRDPACGKWLLSFTLICSFSAVVWISTIFHCYYVIFILFPSWFTSERNWKEKWGSGRTWNIQAIKTLESYLVLYVVMICVPVLCSSPPSKFLEGILSQHYSV